MAASVLVRGSINIDEFYAVKNIVQPGQTISSRSLTKRLGGKGANQAVAAACAGATVLLDGAVGGDEEGQAVKDKLKSSVLVDRVQLVKGVSTGKAVIQVADDGENSIIILGGANAADIPIYDPLIPEGTTHLLLANEIPLYSTINYLKSASSSAVTTIFNPSPMLTQDELSLFPFSSLDWLLINEGEMHQISSILLASHSTSEYSPSLAPQDLAKLLFTKAFNSRTNVICTLGAQGVIYVRASPSSELEFGARPAAKLLNPLKDTTGAGDCFMGFFAAGLAKLAKEKGKHSSKDINKEEFEEVVNVAVTACALCVENQGAQDSYRSIEQVRERIAHNF